MALPAKNTSTLLYGNVSPALEDIRKRENILRSYLASKQAAKDMAAALYSQATPQTGYGQPGQFGRQGQPGQFGQQGQPTGQPGLDWAGGGQYAGTEATKHLISQWIGDASAAQALGPLAALITLTATNEPYRKGTFTPWAGRTGKVGWPYLPGEPELEYEQTPYSSGFGMGWMEEITDALFGWIPGLGNFLGRRFPNLGIGAEFSPFSLDEYNPYVTTTKDIGGPGKVEPLTKSLKEYTSPVVSQWQSLIQMLPESEKDKLGDVKFEAAVGRKDIETMPEKYKAGLLKNIYEEWAKPLLKSAGIYAPSWEEEGKLTQYAPWKGGKFGGIRYNYPFDVSELQYGNIMAERQLAQMLPLLYSKVFSA